MKKLKTGRLYNDARLAVSRSASGSVSVFCKGPVEMWRAAGPRFDTCIVIDNEYMTLATDGTSHMTPDPKSPIAKKRKKAYELKQRKRS